MKNVVRVAGKAKQQGHGVPYKNRISEQQDAKQAARHAADMARVEKLHQCGCQK